MFNFSEYYHCKLWHYTFPLAMLFAGCGLAFSDNPVWRFASWVLLGLAILLGGLVMPVLMVMTSNSERDKSLTEYARSVQGMDPDRYDALGLRVPSVRIRLKDQVAVPYFEDTECTMETFKKIVDLSNRYQIFEERSLTGRKRKEWQSLVDWLILNYYLVPDSAQGNHSYLWHQGRFQLLVEACVRYLRAGILEQFKDQSTPAADLLEQPEAMGEAA